MRSSIYIFGFYGFLWFTLDLYILELSLKCLMTSGSIKSKETTNSLFLRISFLILFFLVFVKHKSDSRLKYVLAASVSLSSIFYLPVNDNIVYNNIKLCNRLELYSPDSMSTCNELHETCLLSQFSKINSINLIQSLNLI